MAATDEQKLRDAANEGEVGRVKTLIKRGADVNSPEEVDLWTPLHYAANGNTTGHYDSALALLKAGADVDAQNVMGETALHLAAVRVDTRMVDGLMENGASLDIQDNRGRTPFYVAVPLNSTLAAKLNPTPLPGARNPGGGFIFGRTMAGPNTTAGIGEEKRLQEDRAKGEQELRDTAQEGDLVGVEDVIRLYKKKGIDIDAVDDQGYSALYLAVYNDRRHVVAFLLEEGADPALVHEQTFQTPLHVAAERGVVNIVGLLLPELSKGDVDAKDRDRNTPLFIAAEKGHADVVQALLEGDADVNALNKKDESPLYVAAVEGHEEVVRALLGAPEPQRSQLDVDAPNKIGFTPLHAAAMNGSVSIAKSILDAGGEREARDAKGETPLLIAAAQGQTRMVTLLLENYNVDVDASNSVGETPLYVASVGGHVAVVDVLLKNGADTEASINNGFTPLMVAAQEGQTRVMSKLLEKKANVHAANNNGETPLLIAALEGYQSAVALLLDNGADILAAQNGGKTALHLAAWDGHVGVVKALLAASETSKPTPDGGFKMSPVHLATDTKGETALHSAVRFGHVSVVELLIKHDEKLRARQESLPPGERDPVSGLIYGRLIDMPNKFGWTPLHTAVDSAQRAALTFLLRQDSVNVNAADKYGNTPLHLAARRKDKRLVADLLAVPGIYVSSENIEGRTPLHFASGCIRPDAIAKLLTSGADHTAQDKRGATPIQALGDEGVCNPIYVFDDGLCSTLGGNLTSSTTSFKGDFCPVALGVQGKMEADALLKVATNKTQNTPNTPPPGRVPAQLIEPQITFETPPNAPIDPPPPAAPSIPSPPTAGRDKITLTVIASLVPILLFALLLVALIFVLARKRHRRRELDSQRRLERQERRVRRRRTRRQQGVTHSNKKLGGYSGQSHPHRPHAPSPEPASRSGEGLPFDLQYQLRYLGPRGSTPLDLEESYSSHLEEGFGDGSSSESSGDDGTCCWSDADSDENYQQPSGHLNGEPSTSAEMSGEGDLDMKEVCVVMRTISRSSSDGEMHEKRDAVGPLPSER
ncbi:hypothetical protein BSKO_11109 [Bryopsis sp. KO-2023]|nr:hypothetical protein BSKO_11109 [Bryopsis sp. KO-2023]